MTTPIDATPQLEPIRDASSPAPNSSLPGVPAGVLARIQQYLAPLQRLGAQRVAWIGAALLFIGVFLPIKAVSIPLVNLTVSASFWDLSKFESLVLLLAALASAWLAWIHDYKWLAATGVVSILFLIIEFFDALTSSYLHPSWGWLILFPGVVLLLAAAAMKRDARESQGNAAGVVRGLLQRAAAGR